MTANFTETSISRNAKREYPKIADIETFETAVQKFIDDETMNLTKKEAATDTYKAKVNYFNADSIKTGYITFYTSDKENYDALAPFLTQSVIAEKAAGEGGEGSRADDEDAWSKKFSCAIGEDTFSVTFTRDYALISGFAEDDTLTTIETWADTVEEFGGVSA